MTQSRSHESDAKPYAYCVLCGYMFIKTPPLPPIPCRCGAMQEASNR